MEAQEVPERRQRKPEKAYNLQQCRRDHFSSGVVVLHIRKPYEEPARLARLRKLTTEAGEPASRRQNQPSSFRRCSEDASDTERPPGSAPSPTACVTPPRCPQHPGRCCLHGLGGPTCPHPYPTRSPTDRTLPTASIPEHPVPSGPTSRALLAPAAAAELVPPRRPPEAGPLRTAGAGTSPGPSPRAGSGDRGAAGTDLRASAPGHSSIASPRLWRWSPAAARSATSGAAPWPGGAGCSSSASPHAAPGSPAQRRRPLSSPGTGGGGHMGPRGSPAAPQPRHRCPGRAALPLPERRPPRPRGSAAAASLPPSPPSALLSLPRASSPAARGRCPGLWLGSRPDRDPAPLGLRHHRRPGTPHVPRSRA
ncbi:translation initiation factor IF-2-like [Malurus melanocephalus]|uniref:translation initiation factor IF-2-like n=1 Tax=Malurus melanocephalus TaxID=175006 RepID=UPI002546E593|nr:translation initiation factor IF-2-like [Malurus melanocephalus]